MALVEEQGEMFDVIEHNIELATAHVEVGQQNICRAAEYSCSNRAVSGL
jgi:t-SNARE complex subunit (syntaxin)